MCINRIDVVYTSGTLSYFNLRYRDDTTVIQ